MNKVTLLLFVKHNLKRKLKGTKLTFPSRHTNVFSVHLKQTIMLTRQLTIEAFAKAVINMCAEVVCLCSDSLMSAWHEVYISTSCIYLDVGLSTWAAFSITSKENECLNCFNKSLHSSIKH